MNELYQGKVKLKDIDDALEELGIIKKELQSFSPERIVWDIEDLAKQPPWGNDLGKVQPWKAYYDEYGRLIARTDYNAGNIAQGISDTHYHLYEWGPGKTPFEYGSHIEGEYIP